MADVLSGADWAVTTEQAFRALRLVMWLSNNLDEIYQQIWEYDEAHPDWLNHCSQHGSAPSDCCGQRDIPEFYMSTCLGSSYIGDARRLLEEVRQQGPNGQTPLAAAPPPVSDGLDASDEPTPVAAHSGEPGGAERP